jgi:hypothetical protein
VSVADAFMPRRRRCAAFRGRAAAGVMIGAVTADLPALSILVAGEPARSSSTIAATGGYVVVVTTTVPALALTLTSAYLGALARDAELSAAHLRLAPQLQPQLSHRFLTGWQPGSTHARACMLDHAAQLRDALAELTGAPVTIDVGSDVLEHAAGAWGPSQAPPP